MQLSDNGLRFIATFEGFVPRLYDDPAGHCTVGYGHLVHLGQCDGRSSELVYLNGISASRGLTLLQQDVERFESCINGAVHVPLSQNRFDALVSFAFNVGCGAFESSTLLRKLNNGEHHRVCDELMRWVHGGGEVLQGLVRRREAECELFNRSASSTLPVEGEEDMAVMLTHEGTTDIWVTNFVHLVQVQSSEHRDYLSYSGVPGPIEVDRAFIYFIRDAEVAAR